MYTKPDLKTKFCLICTDAKLNLTDVTNTFPRVLRELGPSKRLGSADLLKDYNLGSWDLLRRASVESLEAVTLKCILGQPDLGRVWGS